MVTFTACRRQPELVAPARATPRELKYLSDIDNERSLRFYATMVEFFRGDAEDGVLPRRDPVVAIRSALAEALVYYYPLGGRLRELQPDGRLVVDCTAEEADADVTLAELGEPLLPPYPCVDELLCDLGDSRVVVGKPLWFIQVTRFKCGGLAVGLHCCHVMNDGFGICQFIQAVGDLARGEPRPLVLPVWQREILTSLFPYAPARRVTRPQLGYEPLPMAGDTADDVMLTTPAADMVGRYFLFGPPELSALRGRVSGRLGQSRQTCTTFDLVAAATWRCRTAALGYAAGHRVRFMFTSNARRGWKRDPPIPPGYYGCALVLPVAETTAGKLCRTGLAYAVRLVREAKLEVDDEYLRGTVALLASRRWPSLVVGHTYVVSDITAIGEDRIDFGWGKPIGGGVPMAGDTMSTLASYFMKCKDARGEVCIVVPMYLPRAAMDRFAKEISAWTKKIDSKY